MTTEVTYEIARADLFRAYAKIMEAPRRGPEGKSSPPVTINLAAAQCFRFVAEAIERNDPYLPKEWRAA